ncbi:hypothetical protein BCR35DRAFT_335748 [Leucosporidium creatinivorum]|uniref:Small EDRK-rich factor-like N-terminal domain-containing protein n=1 Tax=Leucosporidium creatinivorum TaxID=106004 RepID=A0A1Y2D613_9BASI|nr:hypothetical protein BCR35DRAFT_335748 [Leucosporidium creatinivorum]
MARGNQRENDRAKAQKKAAAANKGNKDTGVSFKARQESDAQKMREKNALADAKKAAEADAAAAALRAAKAKQ